VILKNCRNGKLVVSSDKITKYTKQGVHSKRRKKGISEPINMGSSFEDLGERISNMKAVHNLDKRFLRCFDWQQQSRNKYSYDLCAREGEIPLKFSRVANSPIGKRPIGSFIVRM
jgi:hypothetical protein